MRNKSQTSNERMSLTRRNFLQQSTAVGTSLLLSSLETFASEHPPAFTGNKAFDLKVMGTSWGFPGNWDTLCAKAKKEGYDGIEMWWPLDKAKQDELFAALKKHQLEIGFLCGGSQS